MEERLLRSRERQAMRRELQAMRLAESEGLAQRHAALREGLAGDAGAFAAALDSCVAEWQDACRESRYNQYVWRGPEDTTVAEICQNARRALALLERSLDDSEFPAVARIERYEGFRHCLTDGYNSDASLDYSDEEGRASKVEVCTPATQTDCCDAYGLLAGRVCENEVHNQAALRRFEPLLRGVPVATLIDYSNDNHFDHWDEGSYWPSARVLVFEFAGRTFSLVNAHMGWSYEWDD